MRLRWKLAFGMAVFNDFLDLVGIASVPLVGDLLDVATTGLLWKTMGTKYTLPTLLEFVPGLDVLPIYTLTVAWAYRMDEELAPSKKGMHDIEVK